jgi:hypothetical protein
MTNKVEQKPKRKVKLQIAKDAKNRAVALVCLVSLNIVAIFSDSIVGQLKESISPEDNIIKNIETENRIIEVEHSGVKELIELQEKYHKLNAKYDTLEDKISKLQNSQNSSHIIISYFSLLNKIKKGQNYQDDLLLTKSLINQDSKLYENFIKFDNLLKSNIKGHQDIQNNFDQLVSKIKSYDRIQNNDSLADKIKNNILNQIIIRKINFEKEEPDNIDYLIHKIENNLQQEHYQEALNYLNKIINIPPKLLSNLKKDLKNLIKLQEINKKIMKLLI